MNPLNAAFLALVLFVASASAAYWESEDFGCSINLPDGQASYSEKNWTTIGSTEEGTLVGASRVDRSAFIFLGYVDLSKRKNFHLNEKSIEELEQRFFGSGQVFRRGLERISLHENMAATPIGTGSKVVDINIRCSARVKAQPAAPGRWERR